ncbi:hypothetical protein [Oceanicoccus sp. KOV_DT_Chl]|uniref:hypothetical protein n=1 Tax=Oceanicoccus sp. KOV_DT_Chl TaxID=1904639 RepID=UPI000C7E395F|nr:hypothetical protein [Oceanicoccus sp. KOV_DT_Chl]
MVAITRKQQGFSVIMAVFIIVVLSMLAAVMLNILSVGTESVAREIISSRALMAAESGTQRKLNEIFPPPSTVANTASCANSANTVQNWLYNAAQGNAFNGLTGCFEVSVDCSYVLVNGTHYFTIISTGSCGPVGDPAVRVVEVQAKDNI